MEELYNDYPYATGISSALTAHFHKMASDIVDLLDLKDQEKTVVVDIGSNDGTLLHGFKNFNMLVLGIEPAWPIAEMALNKGILTYNAYFGPPAVEFIKKTHGKAKVVTATNVLTHVDEIYPFLENVKAILDKDGVFVFEVYYLLRLLANGAFDQVYHEHLSYFTARTLYRLFGNAEMELFHLEEVPVHGGSLRGYVGWPGEHPVRNSVWQMLEEEPPVGELYGRYEDFGEKVQIIRMDLRNFLERVYVEKKTVWGYGAAAKATVLMNYISLGPDASHSILNWIPYVVDANPLKQGKVIPGVRVPIKPPAIFHYLSRTAWPDYVIIFPWNLADEIVKELSFLKPQTKFVVAVPELVVLN